MYKKLNQHLSSISNKDLGSQMEILNNAFEEWKGSLEQVDDVCIVGIHL